MTSAAWVVLMGTLALAGVLTGALLTHLRRRRRPRPRLAWTPYQREAVRRLAAVMRDRPHRQ